MTTKLAPKSRARLLLLSGLLFGGLLAGYVATSAPMLWAHLQGHMSTGREASDLGGGARVIAPQGWNVRPLVRELSLWPPLPPLRDYSAIFGTPTGVVITSPDGVLTVEMRWGDEASLESMRMEFGETKGGNESPPPDNKEWRSEQLASGVTLTHLDSETAIFAVLHPGSKSNAEAAVTVLARTNGPGIEAYRPALSEVLEQVSLGD